MGTGVSKSGRPISRWAMVFPSRSRAAAASNTRRIPDPANAAIRADPVRCVTTDPSGRCRRPSTRFGGRGRNPCGIEHLTESPGGARRHGMADTASNLDYLRRVPIFSGLPARELQFISRSVKERAYDAGAVIVKQGDPGVGFFIIAEGRGEVARDGRRLRDMGPGEFFGEMALMEERIRTAPPPPPPRPRGPPPPAPRRAAGPRPRDHPAACRRPGSRTV